MVHGFVNFLHLLATAIWIGGAIYIHFILFPALKQIDQQQSGKLQGIIAKRFSIVAWTCLIILLITGYIKTPYNLLLNFSPGFGLTLAIKHILIFGMIVVGLNIPLRIVPNMQRNAPQPGEAPSLEFFKY